MAIDNQQALIGAIISKPKKLLEVEPYLKPGDLTGEAAIVFSIIREMLGADEHIDVVTVATRLKGKVSPRWLAESTDFVVPAAAVSYAEDIARQGKVRRIKQSLGVIGNTALNLGPECALEEILALYSSEAGTSRQSAHPKEVVKRFDAVVAENIRRGYVLGAQTGYDILANGMIEYVPSHCWVIGAPPGGGKTSLAVDMLVRLGAARVAVFSTEASEERIVSLYIANKTGVSPGIVLRGNIMGAAVESIASARKELSSSGIRIYDSVYDLSDIQAEVRKIAMQGGVDVVMIDFVQNCTTGKTTDEYASQTKLARELQSLMKEVRACGIFFSQLPNDFITDMAKGGLRFKGTGAWNQIADYGAVMMKHATDERLRRIDFRKNRHGPLFSMDLVYVNNFTRLEEVTA